MVGFVVVVELLFGVVIAAAFHASDSALVLVLIMRGSDEFIFRNENRTRFLIVEDAVNGLEMAFDDVGFLRGVVRANAAFHVDAFVGGFHVHLHAAEIGR